MTSLEDDEFEDRGPALTPWTNKPFNAKISTKPTKKLGDHEEYIPEINILLLGETGVGKSTFINAFVNYLSYDNLKDAEVEELTSLIPTKFVITDDSYLEGRTIEVGSSKNESRIVGASATQSCKSYVFRVDDIKVRLIDTPGIGDTRGADQDKANLENILRYLGEFEELHAICILLKPNNARLTIVFEYCIKQLLSKLQKDASKNIVFLFTNSRSTFYRPGDSILPLKKILEEIRTNPPHVKIPFSKNNIYCVDSEAFRFLAALKQGISFAIDEKSDFERSWIKSSLECWRMLKYVAGIEYNGLIPFRVQATVSINEARRVIIRLSQPLAEVAQLIQNNLLVLERHIKYLREKSKNSKELEEKLYIPVINVTVQKMDQPRTTCTARKCLEVYEVSGIKHIHYKQLCHKPCYLRNVPVEIIGSPELIHCTAMGGTKNCKTCGCSYDVHMHIYYETKTCADQIVGVNIKSQISEGKTEAEVVQSKIKEIEDRSKEYALEEATITKTLAKFAHFLQANAITPYNDAYNQYLVYLIDRENSLGDEKDKELVKFYEKMLKYYYSEKKILDDALKTGKTTDFNKSHLEIADNILLTVKSLYKLKHTGAKIKELYDKQEKARAHEISAEEDHIHPKISRRNRFLRHIFD